jgi:hypothetical protein
VVGLLHPCCAVALIRNSMVRSWHGRSMGTACYVWIGLKAWI